MSLSAYVHRFHEPREGDRRTLVLLHGTGGDEVEFARTGELVAPTAARLSLRGDVDENGMARFFRRRAEGVYDLEDLARRTATLGAFITAALTAYERSPDRAVGIGYSNGANILANLAFTRPGGLAGYGLLHPLIPFAPEPQPGFAGTPVFVSSGARDPICPPALTARLERYFESQGARLTRVQHGGGHELQPAEIAGLRRWLDDCGGAAQ